MSRHLAVRDAIKLTPLLVCPLSERKSGKTEGSLNQCLIWRNTQVVEMSNKYVRNTHNTTNCRISVLQKSSSPSHPEATIILPAFDYAPPQLHFSLKINSEFNLYIKCNESVSQMLYLSAVLCLLFLDALKSISVSHFLNFLFSWLTTIGLLRIQKC